MTDSVPRALRSRFLSTFLGAFSKWNVLGTMTLVSGILIGVGVPIWQELVLQAPEVTLELNGIKKGFEDNAFITLSADPELSILNDTVIQPLQRSIFSPVILDAKRRYASPYSIQPDEVKQIIQIADQNLERQKQNVSQMKQLRDELSKERVENLTYISFSRYSDRINKRITSPSDFAEKKDKNETDTISGWKSKLLSEYDSDITTTEARLTDLTHRLPIAEKKIMELLDQFSENNSIFVVSAVLNNPGRSEISVKRPGLLRVYIGPGNYIDLRLLASYEKQTLDVPAHGSRPVTFTSVELSTLPSDDRKALSQYWKLSASAILFVEDAFGVVRFSNRVPFTESTYQKTVYDRLAAEATKSSQLNR